MSTRAAQIVTAAHRDLCTHRPINNIIIIIIIQHFYSAYRVRGYRGAGGARLSPCEQVSLEMSLECLNKP